MVSTLSGLKAAHNKYIFKVRSDFILSKYNFLDFWGKFPKSDPRYKIFTHKLLSCSYFARDPRATKSPYAFHPSDIAFFGLREDLINLFDIPLIDKESDKYVKFGDGLYNRYVPEQYLWIGCLRKNGKVIECEHHRYTSDKIKTDTEKYFASNFIFLSWKQFGLIAPKKFDNMVENDYESCITHREWVALYKKYVDSSAQLPAVDEERVRLQRQKRRGKTYQHIAKIITALIVGKSNKEFRHRLRAKIVSFLTDKFG
jgi:hypothetical protein